MESRRGSNLSKNRPKGSPVSKEVKDGIKWDLTPNQTTRTPRASSSLESFGNQGDVSDLFSDINSALGQKDRTIKELELKCLSLERKISLKSSQPIISPIFPLSITPTKTPHYIPDLYSGTRSERNGRPLCLETLTKVTSICASGGQFSKFEVQSILNNEVELNENTFYNNSHHVWLAVEGVFKDFINDYAEKLIQKGSNISISFDGSWQKRYGYNSKCGRFTVIDNASGIILFGLPMNMEQKRIVNGISTTVSESTYQGSAKGMEGFGLSAFLDWASEMELLNLINIICCDKDSSIHKLIMSDNRCQHIELLYDPGHVKKSFQGSLIKIFGKKKRYQTLAMRIAQFMMRSISESKLISDNRDEMIIEFKRRVGYLITHYTSNS